MVEVYKKPSWLHKVAHPLCGGVEAPMMAFAAWLCAAWLNNHTASTLTMAIIDSGVIRPIVGAMAPAREEAAT